jgi:hypothetical protein
MMPRTNALKKIGAASHDRRKSRPRAAEYSWRAQGRQCKRSVLVMDCADLDDLPGRLGERF